jgi:hypothetical protein
MSVTNYCRGGGGDSSRTMAAQHSLTSYLVDAIAAIRAEHYQESWSGVDSMHASHS